MRCPFCNSAAAENLDQCPECGFTLAEVQRVFGVAASLEPGLNDIQQIFSKRERRTILKLLDNFSRKFPQSQFSVVTNAHPSPKLPFTVYGFWLFNTSGLCRKIDKAGDNHDILLVIDSNGGLACLLIGYGLEPFVSQKHVAGILESGEQDLKSRNWLGAVQKIVERTETQLAEICAGFNQTFGIDMQGIYEADKKEKGELVGKGEY